VDDDEVLVLQLRIDQLRNEQRQHLGSILWNFISAQNFPQLCPQFSDFRTNFLPLSLEQISNRKLRTNCCP
jgi:hypothetical protein